MKMEELYERISEYANNCGLKYCPSIEPTELANMLFLKAVEKTKKLIKNGSVIDSFLDRLNNGVYEERGKDTETAIQYFVFSQFRTIRGNEREYATTFVSQSSVGSSKDTDEPSEVIDVTDVEDVIDIEDEYGCEEEHDEGIDLTDESAYTEELLAEWRQAYEKLDEERKANFLGLLNAYHKGDAKVEPLLVRKMKEAVGEKPKTFETIKASKNVAKATFAVSRLLDCTPSIDSYCSHRKTCLKIEFDTVEDRQRHDVVFDDIKEALMPLGWVNGKVWKRKFMFELNEETSNIGQNREGEEVL